MTTPASGREADAAPPKRRRRGRVGSAIARAIRDAPDAGPLADARRYVVQNLADALDDAMRVGNVLLVVKVNAQLERAVSLAGLDVSPSSGSGEVTPDDAVDDRSLDDELAELAAGEPTLGDAAQV